MGKQKAKYPVKLSVAERAELNRKSYQGKCAVREVTRAKILLLADENHEQGNKHDQEICDKLDVSRATVVRIRRLYRSGGLSEALHEKPRCGRPPTISGEIRAKITALACSQTPEGYARWSLRLLADKLVELDIVDSISHKSVGEVLKKTKSSHT